MEKHKKSPDSGKKNEIKSKVKSSPESNKDPPVSHQELQYLTRCTRFRLSTEYELSICNCKHIMKMTIGERHSVVNPQKWLCNICCTTESVWACLSCPNVACGRYIHEHALNHYLDTSHPLVIDVNELYVYCYECEEYVLNDNKSGDLKVLRETLQAIRYQNFTGTTRSGHTLRTAAISADEDVQMRRRLQQQQLDRDDRNFTAIWHSRFVRQRKTFRHWLEYVRYKRIFGTDDASDNDSDELPQEMPITKSPKIESNFVQPVPTSDSILLTNTNNSNPTSTEMSPLIAQSSDLTEVVSSTSNCHFSSHSVVSLPVLSSPPSRFISDSCSLKSDVIKDNRTFDTQSADAVSDPIIPEQIPTPPLSSSPSSQSDVLLKSSQASAVFVLTDSSAPSSQVKTDPATASEKVDNVEKIGDLEQQSSTPSSPDTKSDYESPPDSDKNKLTSASEDNDLSEDEVPLSRLSSEDEVPLSRLSSDTAKRPKRANAASRYKAIINQLSPSLTSIEPIKKRLRMFQKQQDPFQDTNKLIGPRRSVRLSLRLVEANKQKKVLKKRSRKKIKNPGSKQIHRRTQKRTKPERKLPSRTLPTRRTRMQNISKSIYDSVPNRAVTSLIPGVTGLRNLGNTCYLNSIIQVLGHLQKFRRCLVAVQDLEIDEKASEKSGAAKLGMTRRSTLEIYENQASLNVTRRFLKMQAGLNGGRESGSPEKNEDTGSLYNPKKRRYSSNCANTLSLCHELNDLYHVMWSGKWKLVSPYHFLSSVWQLIPSFRGYSQQDAQEFLCELLDKIVSELEIKRRQNATKADRLASKISQVVHTVFEGRLHSKVRCLECHNVSSTCEPFWDLSLEFPQRYHSSSTNSWKNSNQGCSLIEMLEKFTEAERLDGGRVYNCSHCNNLHYNPSRDTRQRRLSAKKPTQKLSEAEKQIKIVDLPQVLRFHLKRFRWSGRNNREKITVPVNFPAELDMMAHCWNDHAAPNAADASFIYDLSAVVIHHGRGFSAGHYTAYCWNDSGKFWVHCNDSNLELCSIDDVMAAQAYILFYSQRGLDPHPHLFTPPSTPPVTPTLFSNASDGAPDQVFIGGKS